MGAKVGARFAGGGASCRRRTRGGRALPAAGSSPGEVAEALRAAGSARIRRHSWTRPHRRCSSTRSRGAATDAVDGGLVLYFAGHARRRGDDVLLQVGGGHLAWSEIAAAVTAARVARAFVVLNVDFPTAEEPPAIDVDLDLLASTRAFDPRTAEARCRAFADAFLGALAGEPAELEPYAHEGRLDAGGVGRYVFAVADPVLRVEILRVGSRPLVVRDQPFTNLKPSPFDVDLHRAARARSRRRGSPRRADSAARFRIARFSGRAPNAGS